MAIATEMCTSFKVQSWRAVHDFTSLTGDVFKVALFENAATLGAATTAYTTANEIVGAGYVAGGAALTNVTPISIGTTALTDFDDITWVVSTITARGCLIYNSTDSDFSVSSHDFGEDKVSSGGDFVLQIPNADTANAILRLA